MTTLSTNRVILGALLPLAAAFVFFYSGNSSGGDGAFITPSQREAALCPAEMSYVPAGTFLAGASGEQVELPDYQPDIVRDPRPRGEFETAAYCIDRYEFPNIQGKVPVGKVAWSRAQETCESFGKRLCSSDEWEKACKGPKNTIYSFGDTWDPSICTASKDYKLGGMADCRSAYFVFDMSGGLTEWTGTKRASSKSRYVVKGGSKSSPEHGYRCAFSNDQRGNYGASDSSLSFRCYKGVE